MVLQQYSEESTGIFQHGYCILRCLSYTFGSLEAESVRLHQMFASMFASICSLLKLLF